MTHEELLAKFDDLNIALSNGFGKAETIIGCIKATRAVVELHKPSENYTGNACGYCFDLNYEPTGLSMEYESFAYPCATIRIIERELA